MTDELEPSPAPPGPSGAPSITAVVCDPSEISRIGVRLALEAHGVRVAGEAGDETSGLALVRSGRFDVALIDVSVPPSPTAALALLQEACRAGTPPVAIGTQADPEAVFAALRAGAVGYLTKEMPAAAWGRAIAAAARGETTVPRAITALLVDYVRSHSATPFAALMPSERRLTRRELTVLESVARGNTNRAVAAELSISVETVRSHVSHILAKLGTPTRGGAVALYHQIRAGQAVL
jgi:DNA-binding NarL/FixJ family response regulator